MDLKTCKTRQPESVSITEERKALVLFLNIDKNRHCTDRGLIINMLKKVLQDLTVGLEQTASALGAEQHIIKYNHSLSASGLFDHIGHHSGYA